MPSSEPADDMYKKDLYKTELCRSWKERHGRCKYGDKCQYAHGFVDLREVPRHPKYKTQLCYSYHFLGFCRYAARCTFLHDDYQQLFPISDIIGNNETLSNSIMPLDPNASVFKPRTQIKSLDQESMYAESTFSSEMQQTLSDNGLEHSASSEYENVPFIGYGFVDASTFLKKQEVSDDYDVLDDKHGLSSGTSNTTSQNVSSEEDCRSRLPIFTMMTSRNNNNNYII